MAQPTRPQWTTCGEQQVEATATDVSYVPDLDAFVIVIRCRFPGAFLILEKE